MEEIDKWGKGAIRENLIPGFGDFGDTPIYGEDVGGETPPFDWSKGYDVEEELTTHLGKPFKITIKDQDLSSSCGGQAVSYLGQVLNAFHDKNTDERSAKFIYAQTFQGIGGSGIVNNAKIAINQGWGLEMDCVSYQDGKPAPEAFYQRVKDITAKARENAKLDKAFDYALVPLNVDTIAKAVRDNHGCVFGITGINNGTWLSKFPKSPTTFVNSWNHFVYCGGAKIVNNKKHFKIWNSWGKSAGEEGTQWLSEDYLKTSILGNNVLWAILTMVIASEVKPTTFKFSQTMRLNSSGGEVFELQKFLNRFGYGTLIVDGKFGELTATAVWKFQTARGLVPDAIFGLKSRTLANQII